MEEKIQDRERRVIYSLTIDENYLAGFKDARTKEELTHTGGNVGHIDSVPLDEVARKKREEKRNLEI